MKDFKISFQQIVAIVIWVSSIVGVYYTMKSEVERLKVQAQETKDKLERYDLKLLDYKLTTLETQMKQTSEKADRIIDILNAE